MSYLMEHPEEIARLERKTDPAVSRHQLELVGVREGMSVLDAGGGTGAVAREAARLVTGAGRVAVMDRSTERLGAGRRLAAEAGLENLEFVEGDLEVAPLDRTFDLVWCRFVFEYLRDPDSALRNLIRMTRPGGTLAVGDLDGNGVFHHPMSPTMRRGLDKLVEALEGSLDPFAGRKLYSRFVAHGLVDVKVRILPYHLYAGTAPPEEVANWQEKFEVAAPRLGSRFQEGEYGAFVQSFLDHLRDPATFSYSCLILVTGTRRLAG